MLLLPTVTAYCNETIVVVHTDPTQASSDYNSTVTRSCTADTDSAAFVTTGILFAVLLLLLGAGILLVDTTVVKLVMAIPFNLILILSLQTSVLYLEAASPSVPGAVTLLNTLFYFCISVVMPSLVVPFMYITWGLIKKMLDPKRRKEQEWEL